jgi:hypothetical protein
MSLSNRFSYPDQLHENTMTARTPHSALLLISSKDRFNLNKNNQYLLDNGAGTYNDYRINHQKLNGFGQIKRVGVSEVSFPWVTPNINPRNNLFLFGVGTDICYYVKIPEGFYDGTSLASTLQEQLNTNIYIYPSEVISSSVGQPDWVVSYDENSHQFDISNTGVGFGFRPCSAPIGLPQPNKYLCEPMSIALASFELTTQSPPQNLVSQINGGWAMMEYTRYIDICSDTLCKFQALKDSLTQQTYTNIICRLYLNNGYLSGVATDLIAVKGDPQFSVKFNNIKYMDWNPDNMIGGFDIKYLDDSGYPLYIPIESSYIPQYINLLLSES